MRTLNNGNVLIGGNNGAGNKGRVVIELESSDTNGIGINIPATPAGGSERSVIQLGDFIIGQDTAANGTKNLAVLNANGTKAVELVNASGVASAYGELFSSVIPLIIAPSGSMGNNGALTSGTANPLTYLKTYTWLPAGAIVTDSLAGWYWTVWTTTTAATVYQETWDSISSPVAVATPTAWATTGPGAFTGPTTDALYMALPCAAAAVTSAFELDINYHQTNNANAKTGKVRFTNLAGTVLATHTLTSLLHAEALTTMRVNGVADKQRITSRLISAAAVARATPILAAETTSAAFSVALSVAKAVATDVVVIESFRLTRAR